MIRHWLLSDNRISSTRDRTVGSGSAWCRSISAFSRSVAALLADAVAVGDAGRDPGNLAQEVARRSGERRWPHVARPVRLGDQPLLAIPTGELRDVDLDPRVRGVADARGANRVLPDRRVAVGAVVLAAPLPEDVDDRPGPVEQRLACDLRPDAVDEDDAGPARPAGCRAGDRGLPGLLAGRRRRLDVGRERRRLVGHAVTVACRHARSRRESCSVSALP